MKEYQLVNLTGHEITFLNDEAFIHPDIPPTVKVSIPPSGTLARVGNRTRIVDKIVYNGREICITSTRYGNVKGLPEPSPGVLYIVSKVVAEAVYPDRDDVLIMSGLYRDSSKRVVGCRNLAKLYK